MGAWTEKCVSNRFTWSLYLECANISRHRALITQCVIHTATVPLAMLLSFPLAAHAHQRRTILHFVFLLYPARPRTCPLRIYGGNLPVPCELERDSDVRRCIEITSSLWETGSSVYFTHTPPTHVSCFVQLLGVDSKFCLWLIKMDGWMVVGSRQKEHWVCSSVSLPHRQQQARITWSGRLTERWSDQLTASAEC